MDDLFATLRASDFARLDALGHTYLDHTGSALHPERLVREHADFLGGVVLGNPHSRSPASRAATELVQAARARVLAYFRASADEYEVVFTQNASGALKLVGEAFPFAKGARFCLTADNHNSVNGIREFATRAGASTHYVAIGTDLRVADVEGELADADAAAANLFAFPAQSNFSGVQHPLAYVERAQALGYRVLLDAAAFVPTNRLDLSRTRPEFVAISFYKMFGYPTGIGALLARRDALQEMRRPWFGGGTVRFVAAQHRSHIPYRNAAAFEDGTLNFLEIPAVTRGLDFLETIGVERLHDHVMALTRTLLDGMRTLRHPEGTPMVRVYGTTDLAERGGTVACNLLYPDGRVIDSRCVEAAAAAAGVSLRTGYFCNPGAAETSFELPAEEAARCFQELAGDDFTLHQYSVCLHDRPVGAVRLSLGLSSNASDVERGLAVLASCAAAESARGARVAGAR